MKDIDRYYKKVIESVKLLALPYEQQKLFFPAFVDAPFEVLDTFGHAFLLLPQLVEDNRFSNAGIGSLLRLWNMIELTARTPELKDLEEDQFSTHESWEKVRGLARDALIRIGEPLEKPDPHYI